MTGTQMRGAEVPADGPDTSLPFHVVPELTPPEAGKDAMRAAWQVPVEGAEGRHGVSVRRLQPGEAVVLIDGTGAWAQGPVTVVTGRDRFVVQVQEYGLTPRVQPRVVVVQAIPKTERADEAIELLTAVGVDEIIAWHAERCIARWRGERVARGLTRWRRAAVAASKQARRTTIPDICGPLSTAEVCTLIQSATTGLVCAGPWAPTLAGRVLPQQGQIVIVVGPEGGCTEAELTALSGAGAQPIALGPTVLRSAVAGSIAATLVLAGSGRWHGTTGLDGP